MELRVWSVVMAALLLVLPVHEAATGGTTPQYSRLWGKAGERWEHGPRGRLPDFSYAGYKAGVELPPTSSKLKATVDVTQYGADSKGRIDSIAGIEAAVQSTACRNARQCVVYFPPGTYIMDGNLTIQQPVILRGAGRDRTTLSFQLSWLEITGEMTPGMWAFGPGLLHFNGRQGQAAGTQPPLLATLARNAARGDQRLYVDSTARLKAGQWVRITATDPGSPGARVGPTTTPWAYYLLGQAGAVVDSSDLLWPLNGNGGRNLLDLRAQVTAVGRKFVVIDRRLPVALSTRWGDVLLSEVTAMGVQGQVMGIEEMTVELPSHAPYLGHLKEDGYHGVQFSSAANCFARNLRVKNADNSLTCTSCFQCSFMGIIIDADRQPLKGMYGHHGIWFGRGGNNLVTDFTIAAPQVHDLSVDSNTALNVFRNGVGRNINIDFHRRAPLSNLFTNMDMGLGKRPFASGGEGARGPHAAIFNTIWNVRASGGIKLPLPCDQKFKRTYGCGAFGPSLNLVGANIGNDTAVPDGWWVENIPNNRLVPADLYTAQVQLRLGKAVYTSPPPKPLVPPPKPPSNPSSSSSSSGGRGSSRVQRGRVRRSNVQGNGRIQRNATDWLLELLEWLN